MRPAVLTLCITLTFPALVTFADEPKQATPPTVDQLMSKVSVADGFEATIFATPDQANYPVFCAAAPDGTLYVSSDRNGSLGRNPNMGRILRLRDTKGTGRADEVKEFVPDIDSPRGLVWDKDRLYVVHPPHLSVFIDKDGDGVADEEKVLVKNIAFGYADRPADHTTNGLSIGVDGWLYVACGDFGFMEATGTDGRKLQLRGGGVVRVRPDGTGLELYAYGTRNILEVAMSPLLDGFTRDNTNDGDGWDVRFHHIAPLGNHGYPRLYKFFSNELIKPLADYGGGSGCGAVWIDEPGFPKEWNNLPYTCDWGPGPLFRHSVVPKGATFEETQKPDSLVKVPKSTDADVDAMSHVYVNSWNEGGFSFTSPHIGFIARVTPKGYTPEPLPDFRKADEKTLLSLFESNSHRRRLEAQRELLSRGLSDGVTTALQKIVSDSTKPLATRVLAIYALKQGQGEASHAFLADLSADSTVAPWCIRALTDRWDQLANVPAEPILKGLSSPDARTRKESTIALTRLGKPELAKHLAPLWNDADAVISHLAIEGTIRLKGSDVALSTLDDASTTPPKRDAALRVLQAIHQPSVVDALVQRLEKASNPEIKLALTRTLSRLYNVEGEWKGDSWGTRPDTRGPYYQPEKWEQSDKISNALLTALDKADATQAAAMSAEFARHRIKPGDAIGKLVTLAQNNPEALAPLATQLAQEETIPANAIPLLIKAFNDQEQGMFVRSAAAVALSKTGGQEALDVLFEGLPDFASAKNSKGWGKEVKAARDAFLTAPTLENIHQKMEAIAAEIQGNRSKFAEEALLNLSTRKSGSPEARMLSAKALEEGWKASPKRRKQIMSAMMSSKSLPYAFRALIVEALQDTDPSAQKTAEEAVKALRLDPEKIKASNKSAGAFIATLKGEDVIRDVVKTKGDVNRGEHLFTQQACSNCHTVSKTQPLKGPYLGTIAQTYNRKELAEAILYPNKTIAQGFVTSVYTLKDGSVQTGFVIKEAATAVTIRNIAGQEIVIPSEQVASHTTDPRSMMPEGLAGNLTVSDFASLLDYLEALAKGQQ